MITGYNTDIEHGGVVYHVQTEDKGLDSPIVLSLVYAGGAILAAKRASYADLIAVGFEEATLAERLKRQHHLICAAIHAGRIEDLKQLSKPQTGRLTIQPAAPVAAPEATPDPVPPEPIAAPPTIVEPEIAIPARVKEPPAPPVLDKAPPVIAAERPPDRETGSLIAPDTYIKPPASSLKTTNRSPYTVYDSRRRSRLGEVITEPDGLRITLLGYDPDFRGGQDIQLKALVTRISAGVEEPLIGTAISVKILGTTFRPVLFSLKTDREGVMSVSTRIPPFLSGRAAIVVKAASGDLSTEARWVVYPGK